MNKSKLLTLFLTISYCVLPILLILAINHITLIDTFSKMSSGSFGNQYMYLSVDKNWNKEKMLCLLKIELNAEHFAVCVDEEENGNVIRGIFFNSYYANLPMESGRFFKKSDFFKGNNVAVVGKNRKSEIYEYNQKSFIRIHGIEYQVLGIMGYEKETPMDSYVYVNFLSDYRFSSHVILIDFFSKKSSLYENQMLDIFDENHMSVELLTYTDSFSDSIFPRISSGKWFMVLLLAVIICIILLASLWLDAMQKELHIRRLVGATNGQIAIWVIGKNICIYLISFCVGYLFCTILYPAYITYMMITYMLSGCIELIFLGGTIHQILHQKLEEVLSE